MANTTSLGSHLKQAKKIRFARIVQARECLYFLAPLIRKKHIVFERPYASAAGASEESFSIFCDVFLKKLYIKTYQANVLVLSLHVGKYREKRISCLFKTHMIFVNKNPLHVLGSHENINLEGNSSCTSSKIRLRQSRGLTNTCFFARPRPRNVWYFSASAAGASGENFGDFGDNHMYNSVHIPPQRSSRGAKPPQTT